MLVEQKLPMLVNVLAHHKPENAIIFCNMKVDTQKVAAYLQSKGMEALAIHGDLEQYERNDVLVRFVNKSCSILVATDVAARGLDIKELGMVINYDLPHDETTYTHRIGRTGRAGEKGVACTLYSGRDAHKVDVYEGAGRSFQGGDKLAVDNAFKLSALNKTLVIEGGKKDKMRPGDILGALTKEAGLAGNQIGKIDVYDRQSYVAIEKNVIEEARLHFKQGRIKGRKFPVWVL